MKTFVLFVIFLIIFFYEAIVNGNVFYCCDNLLINIPAKAFLVDEVKAGRFPLWNPYIFSGMPYLADINLSPIYPANIIFFFFEKFRALTIVSILHYLWAMIGMYVLVRGLWGRSVSAAVSAIAFGFSGTMIVYSNNLPMLQAASWLPWMLWGWRNYLDAPEARTLAVFVLVAVAQIFSGHPQLTYLSWLILAGYYVWILITTKRRTVRAVLFACLASLAVASVQILPFLEFAKNSTRLAANYTSATFDSLHPLALIRLIIPNITGVLTEGTSWIFGGSVYGFVGICVLILALFGFRTNRWGKFFGIVVIVSFLLALGKYTPIYQWAFWILPGLKFFRSPQHFLFITTFGLVILSGLGIEELAKLQRKHKWIIITGCVFIAGAAVAWGASQQSVSIPVAFLSGRITEDGMRIVAKGVAVNFFVSGILLNVLFWTLLKRMTHWIIVGCVFIELFFISRNNLLTIPQETVEKWSQKNKNVVSQFDKINWQRDRILVESTLFPAPRTKTFGVFSDDKESSWQWNILRPNLNTLYRMPSIDGYASMVFKPYQEWLETEGKDPTGVNLTDISIHKLVALGTRMILKKDGKVYQNTDVLPRFYLVDIKLVSREGIKITSYTPNKVVLTVEPDRDVELVFMDTNYPGWTAMLDGKKISIQSYQKTFKSIHVPPGIHQVIFDYRPKSVVIGLLLSVAAISTIVFAVFKKTIRRKKQAKRLGRKADR